MATAAAGAPAWEAAADALDAVPACLAVAVVERLELGSPLGLPAAAARGLPAGLETGLDTGAAAAPTQLATGAPASQGNAADRQASRGELSRLLAPSLRKGGNLSEADRTYAAKVVAARTGLSQAEAEKRVSDVIVQAKKTADDTRKATATLLLWLAGSMLAGAVAAMLGATEGGLLRDSKWYEPGWRETIVRRHY